MDPFDETILRLLRNDKPRDLQRILDEVKLSHNTLRLHLDSLAERSLITKIKQPGKGPRRSKITYLTPIGALKSPFTPPSPFTWVVALSFSKLSQVCRFEKRAHSSFLRFP